MRKKKPTKGQLHNIGCYIYHHFPNARKDKECINIVVEHHKIGKLTNKGLALKSSEDKKMLLCVAHHTGDFGIHQLGVETWEKLYTTQDKMIKWTKQQIEGIECDIYQSVVE